MLFVWSWHKKKWSNTLSSGAVYIVLWFRNGLIRLFSLYFILALLTLSGRAIAATSIKAQRTIGELTLGILMTINTGVVDAEIAASFMLSMASCDPDETNLTNHSQKTRQEMLHNIFCSRYINIWWYDHEYTCRRGRSAYATSACRRGCTTLASPTQTVVTCTVDLGETSSDSR